MAELETARLHLRLFTHDDIGALARIYGNPNVLRYLSHEAISSRHAEEAARRSVHRFLDHWDAFGFGVWAIIDKASGELAGYCGLQYVPGLAQVELLYLLDERFWHRGLATEAVLTAVRYGFDELGLQRIVAVVEAANRASRRVLEKVGLIPSDDSPSGDLQVVAYSGGRDAAPAPDEPDDG
jgi:ribosomal-protein-alanine N-acetyltransferase